MASICKIHKYNSFEKIKYVQHTLDIKCLTPSSHRTTQRYLTVDGFLWGGGGGGGGGSSWRERRGSALIFYPVHLHLNFEPSPRNQYITERRRLSSQQGDKGYNQGQKPKSSPYSIKRNQKCSLRHTSKPANAPVSTFLRKDEAFSPLHLLNTQFTCSDLMLPRHEGDWIYLEGGSQSFSFL